MTARLWASAKWWYLFLRMRTIRKEIYADKIQNSAWTCSVGGVCSLGKGRCHAGVSVVFESGTQERC